MAEKKRPAQVVVIGAGPGGYAAAFMAADLGLEVTLIDVDEAPGGTCLHRGCIPSKALLHTAKVIAEARDAKHWGVIYPEPVIEVDKLRASTQAVVDKMTSGLGQLCHARKISRVQGRASFLDSSNLRIHKENGDELDLPFEKVILASGSRPAVLDTFLIDSPNIMNSTDALKLESIPESLLVVGGGYIGLELGSVYAALGSRVTVVELTPSLLPGADTDLIRPLAKRIGSLMEAVLLNTSVEAVKEVSGGIEATFVDAGGKKKMQTFGKVLVSVGRKPNSTGLGLEKTRVHVDEHGFVKVDAQRRTSDPNIFAIGDVAGQPMLAHKATHEGNVAAEVLSGKSVVYEPKAVPAVVFTDPEVAWCGLMEGEAKDQGIDVKVSRFPWSASGRAATFNRPDGLTKIVCDAQTNAILGVGICGTGAGELIAEAALAIEMGAVAGDLSLTIHPHPTLSETLMEGAELIFGRSTHFKGPKKA